jgi:hypothetical protein
VLTTALSVFAELSEIATPGARRTAIAEGIVSVLGTMPARAEILHRHRDWVRTNSWAAQASRVSNIIRG